MILVTGSKGLLGKEVVKCLKNRGHNVYPISRQDFNLSKDNLLDLELTPEAIIHLAAAVPTSFNHDDSLISSNITRKIDNNVFNAAKIWKCKLIYASSCAVYRKDIKIKNENSELDLESKSHYVQAKISGEKQALSIEDSAIFRLPALVGENMKSKSILLTFINNIKEKGSIELWGNGMREQNFLDVSDAADAFDLILQTKTDHKIFNIANHQTITMKKLANIVIILAKAGAISFKNQQDPNENLCVKYNVNLAKKVLKWSATKPINETIQGILSL
jgi:nucleoside-diphosphate-sugar epimerase